MSSMMSYSGILTKVRAMEGRLLTDEDYKKISLLETTTDFVNYIKKNPSYGILFKGIDEQQLHRAQIEQLLLQSSKIDLFKLYRFATHTQRKVLSLLFFRIEVTILMSCLQAIFRSTNSKNSTNLLLHKDLTVQFENFFLQHSDLKVKELANATTIESFISLLQGTRYYALFSKLYDTHHESLQEYEVQLDIYYFTSIWNAKNHILSGAEADAVTMIYGTQIDLLNLLWIYRSKKFYDIDSGKILTHIIPIHYKLKKEQITKLVESVSTEELFKLIHSTYYGKVYGQLITEDIEQLYDFVLSKVYKQCSNKYPASMAPILYFMYLKSKEIDRLTTALEGIRYQLDPNTLLSYVLHKDFPA